MDRIYADEKKHESVIDRVEDDDEDICAVARKFFRWALLITWAACAVTLVSGGDFSLPAAAILITAGIYSALCITKFLHQKKKGDTVIVAAKSLKYTSGSWLSRQPERSVGGMLSTRTASWVEYI